MLIVGEEGTTVEVNVVAYQFPDALGGGARFDYDANWLMVSGRIGDGLLPPWTFLDPCLTTREAAELLAWLRDVAGGSRTKASPGGRPGDISFLEPNLSALLTTISDRTVTIEWLFAQEAAPPGAADSVRFGDGHSVPTTVERGSLLRAIDDWAMQLQRFARR